MKTIYLVRHGEASWQGDTYDLLTDRGIEQARIVGQAIAERGIVPDLVVSGQLERHRQSAQAAAEETGWSARRLEDVRWAEMDYIDVIKAVAPQYSSHADLKAVVGDGPAGNEKFAALFQGALPAGYSIKQVATRSHSNEFCDAGVRRLRAVRCRSSRTSKLLWCSPLAAQSGPLPTARSRALKAVDEAAGLGQRGCQHFLTRPTTALSGVVQRASHTSRAQAWSPTRPIRQSPAEVRMRTNV